jgi:hypothetical protein
MKRSRSIGLLVLGTAALLAGCGGQRPDDLLQNQYASKEDCEKDWGEPQVCTSSTHTSGGYVGPRYYWNRSGGTPMAVMADGSERAMMHSALARGTPSAAKSTVTSSRSGSVSRGGFGSSAHASSGGG